jgi:hypothetical protein
MSETHQSYDDYDPNSPENALEPVYVDDMNIAPGMANIPKTENAPKRFMIVIVGNGTSSGEIIKADIVVFALHQEHAEFIADALLLYIGANYSGRVDSVSEC